MRRLSSVIKPRYELGITLAFLAVSLLALAGAWRGAHRHAAMPWTSWLLPVAPIAAVLMARGWSVSAGGEFDEAWVDGGELLLRRAGLSVRMPLTDIAAAEVDAWGRRVTLRLGMPGAFGDRVRFIAPPRGGRAIVAELRQRIGDARGRRA